MTHCVKIVCDSNFRKTKDLDKNVKKVLKMFSDHFVKKSTPLNTDSDMECVYMYDNLSNDQLRLLKRLLGQNRTILNFKEVVEVAPSKKSAKSKKTPKKTKNTKKEMESEDQCSESESDISNISNSDSSTSSFNYTEDESFIESTNSESNTLSNEFQQISDELVELAQKIKKLSSRIS